MRHTFGTLALLTGLCSAAPALAQDGVFDPVEIGDGVTLDPIVDVRFRVETADQETFPDNATSITVRTRAGAELKWSEKFSFLVESEGTFKLENDYNDTIPSNGIEPFPHASSMVQEVIKVELLLRYL